MQFALGRIRVHASLFTWLLCTLAMTAWFGSFAAYNLANFRPVSNDEVELMEVGYNLATDGVLGSRMYAGFFGAEQHHLWTLPVQHVLDAITFRTFGAGVVQARSVSVFAALAVVWCVGWFALRWYGLAVALLCEVLLLVWRSDLTAGPTGLPLLDVARVARYDVLAVAFDLLALALLDLTPRWPRAGGMLLGVCAGLAGLSQFFGVFALPAVLISGRWYYGKAFSTARWIVAGAALVLTPWLVYVASYRSEFARQMTVYGQRGDFLRPTFYLENIFSEPARYAHLLTERVPEDVVGLAALAYQVSQWLLLIGVWPALLYVVLRRDRLLVPIMVVSAGLLIVVDQTKTPLYAILLVPSICLAMGAGWVHALTRVQRGFHRGLAAASLAISVALLTAVLSEGMRAYGVDRTEAGMVSSYLAVGQRIDTSLRPGALVAGPERWWWALHEHPYISLRSLWFQWTAASVGEHDPRFVDFVNRWRPDSVIVNDNIRADVQAFPKALQEQFWTYLHECTTPVAETDDPTYTNTQVYLVTGCR